MIITDDEIRNIFGRDTYLEPEILSAVLRFTLSFSYAEHRIMGEFGETKKCKEYAEKSSSLDVKNISEEVDYFRNRYTAADGYEHRLLELCNGDKHSFSQISGALSEKSPDHLTLKECMFRICLRLRHNLFHGRKWSYMLEDQIDNLNYATKFLVQALRATGN